MNKNNRVDFENINKMLQLAFSLAKTPIIISVFVTAIRFSLELLGLPENVIFIIGLLWLALAFSIYWGIKLYKENHAYLILLLSLVIFSPISRLTVFVAWWIDTRWEIGTHYSLYFENWVQALLNHVVYGSLVQVIPGFVLGSLSIMIMKNIKSVKD